MILAVLIGGLLMVEPAIAAITSLGLVLLLGMFSSPES